MTDTSTSGRPRRARPWASVVVGGAVLAVAIATVVAASHRAPSTPAVPERPRVSTTAPAAPTVVWRTDFECGDPTWAVGGGMSSFAENRRVAPVPAPLPDGAGQALEVDYPAPPPGDFTGHGTVLASRTSALGIGHPLEDATLTYYVFVPANHRFWSGGKLPGLAGVDAGLPVWRMPDGGRYDEAGWSGRVLFGDDGRAGSGPGRVFTYLYVRRAAGTDIDENRNRSNGRLFGVSVPFRAGAAAAGNYLRLRPGRWNRIDLHYRMNTPGRADGVFEGRLDGALGVRLADVEYRTAAHPDLAIDILDLSSFYGGPAPNRAHETLWFGSVSISTPAG